MWLVDAGAPTYPVPVKWLRAVLLALLASLLFGLAIGTWIRLRLERPTWYIGNTGDPTESAPLAALPGHVGDARALVLDSRHHEQQVREAVHVA